MEGQRLDIKAIAKMTLNKNKSRALPFRGKWFYQIFKYLSFKLTEIS